MKDMLQDLAGERFKQRQEVTVVDCTIRDGGLMNDSKFELDLVRAVYRACALSGVDVCELGYRNSKKMFDQAQFGPWRFCDEEMLKRATDGIEKGNLKVSLMMDAHKSFADDLLPASESVADMIRIATYVRDIDKAILLAQAADQLGYETSLNIMAVTHCHMPELEETLDRSREETNVQTVFIVDSFGNMLLDQISYLVKKFASHIGDKSVGLHFHNNQQLAFANTIAGIAQGATWADSTINGLGRGAGNCPTELLLPFLNNPKLKIEPILDVLGKYICPLKQQIEWGYHIPYMLTGVLNQHPQAAIEQMHLEDPAQKRDYLSFFRKISE